MAMRASPIFKYINTSSMYIGSSTFTRVNDIFVGANLIESITNHSETSYFLKDAIKSREVLNVMEKINKYEIYIFCFGFGDSLFKLKHKVIARKLRYLMHGKYRNLLKIVLLCFFIYRPSTSLRSFKNDTKKILNLIPLTASVILIINLPNNVSWLRNKHRKIYTYQLKNAITKRGFNYSKILDVSNFDESYRGFDSHHLNSKGAELLGKKIKAALDKN